MVRIPHPKGFKHAGLVKIDEQFYPCQIYDMTMSGARFDLANPFDLPDTFTLQLSLGGHLVVRPCYLIRQDREQASVSFKPFAKPGESVRQVGSLDHLARRKE